MKTIRPGILMAAALVCALALTTAQAQQVPLPKTAAEVPGPVAGNTMTKAYVQMIGRMAYLWGWPLVNSHNRRTAFAKVPEPGLEVEANFFVNMAQILRGYHEKQGPITGITMVGSLTVAQTQAGAAVIPFALDHGVWTANADRLSHNMKATYRAPGFNGRFEFWVTGTLSPTARQELQARGFTVVEQVGSRFDIID